MAAIQDSSPAGTQAAGAVPYRYWSIAGGHATAVDGGVIEETTVTIFVNGQELATLMCNPLDQDALALGFLFNEGVIASREDAPGTGQHQPGIGGCSCTAQVQPPRRMILTSGCGGGVAFQDAVASLPALESAFSTTPRPCWTGCATSTRPPACSPRCAACTLDPPHRTGCCSARRTWAPQHARQAGGQGVTAGHPDRDRILLTSGRRHGDGDQGAAHGRAAASRTSPTSASLALAQG